MSIRPRNQIRGLLLVGVGGLGGHGHETHHGHQDRNQGCRHCHIRLWRWLVNGRVQYPAISTGNGADRQWQSSATTQFMRGRLSPIRFGEATRRGVRPGVYLPTGLVRRRAASRGAAATSPSASATLIGLDPAKSRQHHFDWRRSCRFSAPRRPNRRNKKRSKMVYAGALL